MQNRRTFLKQSGIAGGMLLLGSFPFSSMSKEDLIKITILHTNDTQSQIEPFADNAPKFAALGGIQARADQIKKIRAEEENVLLFDAGDFFQGNPYFDVYKGVPEIKAMNMMQYDAVCIGEHDFDGGIDNLATRIKQANFPFLCANYDCTKTSLNNNLLPYTVIRKAGVKFGIFGLGIKLKGLVTDEISNNIKYSDPILKANETAALLKKKEDCDFIICLSHLGLGNTNFNEINDKSLVAQSENIDLIIGGHSHTLLQKPLRYFNQKKKETLIVQAGWGGVHLGRIDYAFSSNKTILSTNAQTVELAK